MKRVPSRCQRCYSSFSSRKNGGHTLRSKLHQSAVYLQATTARQPEFSSRYLKEPANPNKSITRRFSSSAVTKEYLADDAILRLQSLLDPKHLFMIDDMNMWEEVEEILKALGVGNNKRMSTEQVEYAIRLLDKLANSLPQDQVIFASMLDTDVLNRILANWNRQMKAKTQNQQATKLPKRRNRSTKNRDRMLSPDAMAERIDRYRWCSLVQPDHKTFSFVLDSASSLESTPVFANELLEKLLQVSEATPSQVLIDTASICIVMKAWIQCGRPDKAVDWFRRMQDMYRRHGWEQIRPNVVAYTTAIHGWSQLEDKASEAEALFAEQLQEFQEGNEDCRPDTRTFNAVLNAIAKSSESTGGNSLDRCRALLDQMQDLSKNAGWDCSPDQYSLSSTIVCCVNTVGPKEAEKLLLELCKSISIAPSIVPYNGIMRGHAKRGNGDAAVALLKRLKEMDGVVPDETTYNTVLYAWSQSKDPEAPQKAEALLWEMQDNATDISPSVVSFGSVLQCWTQHAEISEEAAIRAENLLRHMQDLDVTPNIICYNTVLNAWSTVARRFYAPNALEKATLLLQEVLALYEQTKSSNLKPTIVTFRTILYLIAESKVPNKADRAKAVVQLMQQYGVKGNKSDDKIVQRLIIPVNGDPSKQ